MLGHHPEYTRRHNTHTGTPTEVTLVAQGDTVTNMDSWAQRCRQAADLGDMGRQKSKAHAARPLSQTGWGTVEDPPKTSSGQLQSRLTETRLHPASVTPVPRLQCPPCMIAPPRSQASQCSCVHPDTGQADPSSSYPTLSSPLPKLGLC
jgi:hypothetical protein